MTVGLRIKKRTDNVGGRERRKGGIAMNRTVEHVRRRYIVAQAGGVDNAQERADTEKQDKEANGRV